MPDAVTPPHQHPEVHPEPNFDPVHRFSAWLERMGKAEATVEAYHADVADLVRAFAPRPAEELLAADLDAYLTARAEHEKWATSTVRRHLHAIKAFYRYMVSEERLRAPGPAESLAEPVLESAEPFVISEDDANRLFSYLEARARRDDGAAERMDLALYGLCYHAALLISEVVGLATSAVHGGPEVMRLEVVGRRGEESTVRVEPPASRWIARWLAERPAPRYKRHRPFVFIHPRTRVHTSRQRAWDRLKRLAAAAGLDDEVAARITPHTLRHSRAARLVERAQGVAEVREALRQRSPRHAAKYLASRAPLTGRAPITGRAPTSGNAGARARRPHGAA
ncbi:MAG TPA: tyrosine-type recombinase/integrase [Gemmatimonadaceae bacterium]|nr:tyrosine-type recombinase/integrase [Gemmatimonadaceae bacterium]